MYNEFYGFLEKPFELTPNPKFLYLARSHREALASMTHGIKNRKGFISMTGEVGTGKTTLIYSLLNSLDEKVKTVFIFHTTITFNELLKTILRELNLATSKENKWDLIHQLIQYLVLMGTRGETLAIIIDEAQNLSSKVMGELQMFSNLEPKIIQVVFVGQPEFEDRLNSEDLRRLKQTIGIRRKIRGLSEAESKDYIHHRLKLVGSSSEIFTPNAISMICRHAQGIPRVINVLCDNALLVGYSLSKKRIDVDIIHEVIKNMEGLSPQKTIPSSTTVVNKFHTFPFGLKFHLNKAYPIIIISLLGLGVFILLTRGSLNQKSVKIWDIKSIKSRYIDTESPSTSTASIPTMGREYRLKEVVAVKKGETISKLTQKYYGMINRTLIDFILELNPEITNVHHIIVDQKIKIPNITEELLIIQSPEHTYKIHAGTFETPDPAKFFKDVPVLKEKKIEILPRKVSPRDTWHRVMIGKFDNVDEVMKIISLLKKNDLLPAFGGLPKIE